MNLEDQHGPAAEWVAQEPNQRAIAKKFRNFLLTYSPDDKSERLYWHKLRAACRGALPSDASLVTCDTYSMVTSACNGTTCAPFAEV